jgi:uncharacterized protein (TIGR03437 family)
MPAGGPGFTINVDGSSFVNGATVQWNGNNRSTLFISPTRLQAAISAIDIATAGKATVTVMNSAPAAGLSAPATFNIVILIPEINTSGVLNGASFKGEVSGGTIVSLFGSNFAFSEQSASIVPLPFTLGGVRVRLNGNDAPLFYISPSQINFLMPFEMLRQSQVSVTAVAPNGQTSAPVGLNLSMFAPGLVTINSQGTRQGAVLIAPGGELAAPVGSVSGRSSRPVRRGEYISIFCTGLGDVTNQPASGAAAAASPVSTTLAAPAVAIGGVTAFVAFSGLAPGFVGLYQVNVLVPANALTGDAVPVVLIIGSVTSNAVTIAVE